MENNLLRLSAFYFESLSKLTLYLFLLFEGVNEYGFICINVLKTTEHLIYIIEPNKFIITLQRI